MTVFTNPLPNHPLLGRHVQHDSRSLDYAVGVLPRSALVSKKWECRIPLLDQGQTGSCTGNAATYWIGTDNAVRPGQTSIGGVPLDEHFARDTLYSLATRLDEFSGQYPPTDTGSSGIGVAKALQQLGFATSYSHAFAFQALQSALQSTPVLIGIPWYNGMFNPSSAGLISVDTSTGLAGGHELMVNELDMENSRVWVTNSWGADWGVNGRAFFSFGDLQKLLADQGDVTVPVAPAPVTPPPAPPQPTPVPPVPVPPTPGPDAADHALFTDTYAWTQARHCGANAKAAKSVRTWAAAKGYSS